ILYLCVQWLNDKMGEQHAPPSVCTISLVWLDYCCGATPLWLSCTRPRLALQEETSPPRKSPNLQNVERLSHRWRCLPSLLQDRTYRNYLYPWFIRWYVVPPSSQHCHRFLR